MAGKPTVVIGRFAEGALDKLSKNALIDLVALLAKDHLEARTPAAVTERAILAHAVARFSTIANIRKDKDTGILSAYDEWTARENAGNALDGVEMTLAEFAGKLEGGKIGSITIVSVSGTKMYYDTYTPMKPKSTAKDSGWMDLPGVVKHDRSGYVYWNWKPQGGVGASSLQGVPLVAIEASGQMTH